MTLLYRAIWQDDRERLGADAEQVFKAWVRDEELDLVVPDEGSVEAPGPVGAAEVIVRRAYAPGIEAVQFELSVDRHDGTERWTTRLTAISGPVGDRWLWVDLERSAGAGSTRPPLAAPRLVGDLLASGLDARVDQVRIRASWIGVAAGGLTPVGLVGLIRNQRRSLPLVVFAEGPDGFTPTVRRAQGVAEQVAAAVQVVVVPASELDEFNAVIGDGLAVGPGAVRVFLPNAGPGGLRPDRHRALTAEQSSGDQLRTAHLLSSILSPTITARRPPPIYDRVRRELRLGRSRSDAELLAFAESEIERLARERDELKDELRMVESDLLETQVDLEESTVDASHLQNQLQAVRIRVAGRTKDAAVLDLALEARSMSEALALGRSLLSHVAIPAGVERDIEELDRHLNSVSWGELTWRGLRALHCYAEGGFDGNFKAWCQNGGHAFAWTANDKKLALRESETVETNRKLAAQRRFPVDPAVDESGSVVMWSHLKIAEGGGPMAPRVYFFDDTRGSTAKVHIGFVGPHRYTENTRTN
jgi:hypothetical protein